MKLISAKRIIDRYKQEYPFDYELNHSDAMEWITSELHLIGAPEAFRHAITNGVDGNIDPLVVSNYRAKLPSDLIKLNFVRDYDDKSVFIPSTDPYEPYTNKYYEGEDQVYKIRDGYIIIGKEEANLELEYEGYYLDKDGYPYIVDNEEIQQALVTTLADMVGKRLWLINKLPSDKYFEINRRRLLYRKTASTSLIDIGTVYETAKNIFLRIVPIHHEHMTNFYNLGKPR